MEASKGKRKEEISRIASRGRISLVHNKGSAVKGDTGQKLQSRREHASSVYAMVASPEEKNPRKKRSVEIFFKRTRFKENKKDPADHGSAENPEEHEMMGSRGIPKENCPRQRRRETIGWNGEEIELMKRPREWSSVTPCHGGWRTVKYTKSYTKIQHKKQRGKVKQQKNKAQGDCTAPPSLSITLQPVTKKRRKKNGD